MRKTPENIHQRLSHDRRISVEYGVPLASMPYKKLTQIIDDLTDSEAVDLRAADLVEAEARAGRFGAFATRIWDGEKEVVEIWSWAD